MLTSSYRNNALLGISGIINACQSPINMKKIKRENCLLSLGGDSKSGGMNIYKYPSRRSQGNNRGSPIISTILQVSNQLASSCSGLDRWDPKAMGADHGFFS